MSRHLKAILIVCVTSGLLFLIGFLLLFKTERVKNYYIETVDDVQERIRKCLKYVPAEKLAVAPDCGLSQTARWASRQKLANMVKGAKLVRQSL